MYEVYHVIAHLQRARVVGHHSAVVGAIQRGAGALQCAACTMPPSMLAYITTVKHKPFIFVMQI